MKTQDVNFGKLAADLRRTAEALDKLTGARRIPVDDLILGALEALGPLSAYRLMKVVLRKNSSRDGFQQIVMMQAAETRVGNDAMSGAYAMSG